METYRMYLVSFYLSVYSLGQVKPLIPASSSKLSSWMGGQIEIAITVINLWFVCLIKKSYLSIYVCMYVSLYLSTQGSI